MIIRQLAINHPDRLVTATIMSSTSDPNAIGAAATGGGVTHGRLPLIMIERLGHVTALASFPTIMPAVLSHVGA